MLPPIPGAAGGNKGQAANMSKYQSSLNNMNPGIVALSKS